MLNMSPFLAAFASRLATPSLRLANSVCTLFVDCTLLTGSALAGLAASSLRTARTGCGAAFACRTMKSIFSAASRRTNRARTSRDAWGAAVREKCIGLSRARSVRARLASLYPNRRVSGTNFEFMGIESFRGSVVSMGYRENKMIGRTLSRTSSKSPMPTRTQQR
jgi:hypothetical protein